MRKLLGCLVLLAGYSMQAYAEDTNDAQVVDETIKAPALATELCTKVSDKLASVSYQECAGIPYLTPRFFSVKGQPILEARYEAGEKQRQAKPIRVLFLGGIHGDEYSSVSVTYKWLNTLNVYHSGAFDWLFVPLVNPDGLLKSRSTRTNANDVDLNRNFEVGDEAVVPVEHWRGLKNRRARYYPGESPLSEPESNVVNQLIDEYKPTVIFSVHAPHGLIDFDGPKVNPMRFGPLKYKALGTYPGSLGGYAWKVKGIPVVTIELASAGSMPSPAVVRQMWVDIVRWVRQS